MRISTGLGGRALRFRAGAGAGASELSGVGFEVSEGSVGV